MITAIYSLSNVHGAEILLLGWILCVLFYIGGCFLIRQNRGDGKAAVWVGLLVAEVLNDLLWALIYYPNGSYLNYGIGAVYGLLLWPLLLLVAGLTVTARNSVRAIRAEEQK